MLDGTPYELFIDKIIDDITAENLIKAKTFKGTIEKVKKKSYTLTCAYGKIYDLGSSVEEESVKSAALYISMLLRHNVDLPAITKIVDKVSFNITSLSKVINKVLMQYLDNEVLEEKCPECGTSLQRINGCISCPECGYSKCG
jgi:ribonucleoside-diphosphate reductase alpha chain